MDVELGTTLFERLLALGVAAPVAAEVGLGLRQLAAQFVPVLCGRFKLPRPVAEDGIERAAAQGETDDDACYEFHWTVVAESLAARPVESGRSPNTHRSLLDALAVIDGNFLEYLL